MPRKNQELIRQNRRRERKLQKKEKALAEAAAVLLLKKVLQPLAAGKGDLIAAEERIKAKIFF